MSISFPNYEQSSEIQEMDERTLEKYLDDDSEFIEYFHNLQYIKQFNILINGLKTECQKLAKHNISLEEHVKRAQNEISKCEAEYSPILSEYERLREQQDDFISKHGTQATIQRLLQFISQGEKECNIMIQDAHNDNTKWTSDDMERFIDTFKMKRKQIHERQNKVSMLADKQ